MSNQAEVPPASELCSAVKQGDLAKVRLLLSEGANVDELDENNDSALHWAVFCGRPDIAEELLSRGADWTVRSGKAGYSLVQEAAWDGSTSILLVLLLYGVDVNVTSSNGCTPLHEAAYRGHLDFVLYLVAAGGNLFRKCTEGKTPLDWARLARQTEVSKWLEDTMKAPATLQNQSAVVLRRVLKDSLKWSTPRLPLPTALQQTLLYQ